MKQASGRLFRADLHVHTRHSRLEALPVLGARDCYSEPREVYLRAKARGMDLVTFTDHDTIDGCLELLSERGDLPDFFISEEVTTRDPVTGCRLHVGVYGIDERLHGEIQRLRGNVRELLVFLEREKIPAALNHVGSSLVRERLAGHELVDLAGLFPLMETRNSAQRRISNDLAGMLAEVLEEGNRPVGRTGGSDAHTSRRIGSAWTEAESMDRASFLAALHGRRTVPRGESARLAPMVRDVYRIVLAYYRDVAGNARGHFSPQGRRKAAACALLSLPLHLVALPALGTLVRQLRVQGAARRHRRVLRESLRTDRAGAVLEAESPRPIGILQAGFPVLPAEAWVPQPESEGA